MIKWNWIYKQMQELLDKPGDSYYSGSKFIRAIQEFTPALPDPQQYLEDRRRQGKSTTRRNFFEDILNDLDEGTRIRAVSTLLEDLGRVTSNAEAVSAIKSHLGTGTTGPTASVPAE